MKRFLTLIALTIALCLNAQMQVPVGFFGDTSTDKKSITFDGVNQYATSIDDIDDIIDNTSSFTMSFVLKGYSTVSSSTVWSMSDNSTNFIIIKTLSNRKIQIVIRGSGVNTTFSTTQVLVADEWATITFVADSSAVNKTLLYCNGVVVFSSTTDYNLSNYSPITLGATSNLSQYYDGTVDEHILFNVPLNQTEVTELNNSLDYTEHSLYNTDAVLYWTFDDADVSGTTLIDKTIHGNDGTMFNSPSRTTDVENP